MTSRKYLPPTVANLEEGQLVRDADAAIARVGQHLAQYIEHYKTRADGAKGKVVITVDFVAVDAGEDTECLNIVTEVKESLPPRPKAIRQAFAEAQPDGLHKILMRPPPPGKGDHPDQSTFDFQASPAAQPAVAEGTTPSTTREE